MLTTTYPVRNAAFVRQRLGIGPMTDDDIEALEDEASALFEETYLEMSPASQDSMQTVKEFCLDWVAEAKMDREVDSYNKAVSCMAEARSQILEIIDEEQAAAEEPPAEEDCPEGFLKIEDT